jgi:hypothetical protein
MLSTMQNKKYTNLDENNNNLQQFTILKLWLDMTVDGLPHKTFADIQIPLFGKSVIGSPKLT